VTEHLLVQHGSGAAEAMLAVAARAELDGPRKAVRFSYRLTGDLSRVEIPRGGPPRRGERLWEHTCFEAFVAPALGTRYFELNFSPSTQWAAYVFDDYRHGMRELAFVQAPSIAVTATADELSVTAAIELAAFPAAPWPWRIGLTAVVEDRAGGRAYFALRHPREKPDFHDVAGFTAWLDGSAR
jgi:hypothetical protein